MTWKNEQKIKKTKKQRMNLRICPGGRAPFAVGDLGVQAEAIDGQDMEEFGKGDNWPDASQIIGRVIVPPPLDGGVEHAEAAGLERAIDLADEPFRVQRVVEDVGELEVEGAVREGLAMEVAGDDERRE